MKQPKRQVLTAVAEQEHPRRLVLHIGTHQQEGAGRVESSALPYFTTVIGSATRVEGVREVTLDLPVGQPGRMALETLGAAAVERGFEVRAVVSARSVAEWGNEAFAHCRQVDLRVDAASYPLLRLSPDVYTAMEWLQADSRVVGLQVLLNHQIITKLTLSRIRTWLDRADFVTLAVQRSGAGEFKHSELVALFDRLSSLWESADRFFHLHVDRSIKPAFFPWNLLSVTCPAADLALHLEADGRLFLGEAPTPFAQLENPAIFAETVERHLASTAGEWSGGPAFDGR